MNRGFAYGVTAFVCLFFGLFFLYPAAIVMEKAFHVEGEGWTFSFVGEVFKNPVYVEGLWNAFALGIASTGVSLLIAFPLAYFFFRDTDDPKVADKVKRMKEELPYLNKVGEEVEKAGLSLGQALKDYRFYLLVLSFVPISFAVGGPIPNFEKISSAFSCNLNAVFSTSQIIFVFSLNKPFKAAVGPENSVPAIGCAAKKFLLFG